MQVLGSVDADPDIDPLFGKKCAPPFIDQCSVCLERMHYPQVGELQPIDSSERIAIEGHRQNHRFAGMPHYRQAVPDPARPEHLREKIVEGLLSDDSLGASIRKVTIFAIDVTERGSLDDQQLYLGHRATPDSVLADLHQLRHQLFHRLGGPLRQLFQGQPQRRRGPQPQFPHRLPQATWRFSLADVVSLSDLATADTASRMAASRSETRASSKARGCKPVGWSLAALGAAGPSNNAPTAPAGMSSKSTFMYFSRSDIALPHDRPSIGE